MAGGTERSKAPRARSRHAAKRDDRSGRAPRDQTEAHRAERGGAGVAARGEHGRQEDEVGARRKGHAQGALVVRRRGDEPAARERPAATGAVDAAGCRPDPAGDDDEAAPAGKLLDPVKERDAAGWCPAVVAKDDAGSSR